MAPPLFLFQLNSTNDEIPTQIQGRRTLLDANQERPSLPEPRSRIAYFVFGSKLPRPILKQIQLLIVNLGTYRQLCRLKSSPAKFSFLLEWRGL